MNREQQGVVLFLSLALGLFFFLTAPSSARKGFSRHPAAEKIPAGRVAEGQIMVEVDGRVNQRGMVQIEGGRTLMEVLEKAGGIKGDLSLPLDLLQARIDRSSRLQVLPDGDGKGKISLEPLAPSKQKVLALPVSLNTATVDELDTLAGIGPRTAQAIVEYRETYGRFTSVEELLRVPGIGPNKLAALRPHITIQ
jgi:competence protein ComEA